MKKIVGILLVVLILVTGIFTGCSHKKKSLSDLDMSNPADRREFNDFLDWSSRH